VLVCSAEESLLMCTYGAAERTGRLVWLAVNVCGLSCLIMKDDAISVKICEVRSKAVMKFCGDGK